MGTGLAVRDLVLEQRPGAPGAAALGARLEACRQLVYRAGATVDQDQDAGYLLGGQGGGGCAGPLLRSLGGPLARPRRSVGAPVIGEVVPRCLRV